MCLFDKAAVFTDIHLGLKSNSESHNQDCIDFTKWMIATAKEKGCEICIFLGDFHNNRSSISIITLDYSIKLLEMLSESFKKIYFIPGNHDIFFKDKRDVQSITWAKHIKNITIINEITSIDDVVFVPWLVKDEYEKLKHIKTKYMFGHFELPSFYMNSMIKMPDHGELNNNDLKNIGHVFSGHFHKRQMLNNITYIGNCFPHNFGDAGDDDRGFMILGWGKTPEFYTWKDQPKYRTYLLSEIINEPEKKLENKMYVKATVDTALSYEESLYIREQLINNFNLREFTFIPVKLAEITTDTTSTTFRSVDQIVTEELSKINSDQFSTDMLLQIYQTL